MVRSIKLVDNELVIIYNKKTSLGKKTLAYGQTVTRKINQQEINEVELSTTLFRIILNKLELRPKDLLNKADSFYQSEIRGRDFSEEEWLSLLKKNPELLKAPIALFKGHVVLCKTPTDILKLSA